MPSQSKLIKQGIYLTDNVFDEIIQRVNKGMKASDTLEHFLSKYKEYTNGNGENNPLVINGYKDKMLDIILKETNNHKFGRPAQKELVRVTIENRVGDLIVDVGDDIKTNVRDIIKHGYNNNLSQDEIAENLTHKVTVIKNTRARTIARTEIARTATASDYVINLERGATHFTVDCRNTCCTICKKDYNFGKKEYTIDQVEMLPPRHPNCRCYCRFYMKDGFGVEMVDGKPVVRRMEDIGKPLSPQEQTINETTTKKPKKESETKTTDSDSIFKGNPTVHTETDKVNGSKITVYKYENGFELGINENAQFTFEEIVAHIESLPEPLKNNEYLKRVNIKDYATKDSSGDYVDSERRVNVYVTSSKANMLDTLTHELAHALDAKEKIGKNFHLSFADTYEKIFKADNKLYSYVNEHTGRKRTVKKFPTDYAKRSYVKYLKQFKEKVKLTKKSKTIKKSELTNTTFMEDFAESTKLYLNPKTHNDFVKDFPNRAEYLKGIYGKPVFDKNSPLSKLLAEDENQQRQKELAKKESKTREERFNKLTKKELDAELEKLFGDKEKVKAYRKMEEEYTKLQSVQDAIGLYDDIPSRVKVLTKAGWSESMAKNIAQNPNNYLSKVNAKKRKYREVINSTKELIKENLDLTKTSKPIPKPKPAPKQKTKSKPKTPKKTKKKTKDTTPKKESVDPVKRGKVKNVTYEEYSGFDYRGPKVIEYEDGTAIKFKKHGNPDYPGQTLDEITIDGKTIKYHDEKNVHNHFKYQDDQLTPDELKFADKFIDMYGTYAGKSFNNQVRGTITEKDLANIKDDEAFKWLMKNKEKYNEILEKSVIEEDTLTMRIQAKNYLKDGEKTIKDKGFTSSSAAASRTNLIEFFGNGRDVNSNWTFITVTPAGTKGARFQGNSVARNYGAIDDDFEMEITYKQNMEFDILLKDDENKIIIIKPKRG